MHFCGMLDWYIPPPSPSPFILAVSRSKYSNFPFRTVKYVFMSPPRITLCLFWAISIAVTVVIWVLVLDVHDTPQSTHVGSQPATVKQLTSSLNKKRKLFHALAVV